MRKIVFLLIVVGLCLFAALPGLCQTFSFENISASVEIPDSYTILTPDNMESNSDFLKSRGMTTDIMLKSFEVEGILAQAYDQSGSVCLQISALKDVDAQTYFDIDQQSTKVRAAYRRQHLEGDTYKTLGITYDNAEWQNTKEYGRFLMLKYVQRIGGKVDHRGFARRTIRNGYTITVDYQVYNRSIKAKDNNALNDVMDTWRFMQVLPMGSTDTGSNSSGNNNSNSSAVVQTVQITKAPPKQTNSASFTVEGVTAVGAEISGSVLRMSADKPTLVNATADKSGKFSLAVELPQEGGYVMALTVTINDVDTDLKYEITYDKTLLPVSMASTVPETLTSDKLEISGTTDPGVAAECIVNGNSTKQKVGRDGKFSFNIDTSAEGTYSFVLNFTKDGLVPMQFTYYASRERSESEQQALWKKEAIKPAHSTLTAKIKGYTGRIMGYRAYVKEISKTGDTWLIYLAFRKIESAYRDIIVVMTKEDPNFSVDSQVKMYGRCTGMYTVQDDSGEKDYPSFDLLFWGE